MQDQPHTSSSDQGAIAEQSVSSKDDASFMNNRRQLLKLGAAGMPMVLTLRASASGALISQLQCVFKFDKKHRILVDHTGAAWVGTRNVNYNASKGFKIASINKFKDKAHYVFPAGSAPASYRPSACPPEDDGCGDNGGHSWEEAAFNHSGSDEHGYFAADNLGRTTGGGGHGHSQDCDNHGHSNSSSNSQWIDCGYSYYKYNQNSTIKPGDYVNSNGNWSISGDEGLYLSLSFIYADEYGNTGSWPGISCIVSILNYLGQ